MSPYAGSSKTVFGAGFHEDTNETHIAKLQRQMNEVCMDELRWAQVAMPNLDQLKGITDYKDNNFCLYVLKNFYLMSDLGHVLLGVVCMLVSAFVAYERKQQLCISALRRGNFNLHNLQHWRRQAGHRTHTALRRDVDGLRGADIGPVDNDRASRQH